MARTSRRTGRSRLGAALFVTVCLIVWAHGVAGVERPSGKHAVLIPVNGPIGPGTSDFFVRQLQAAGEAEAHLVVIRLDTPGGLETSMRDMIQAILAAKMPVVAFVAPSGARAASAGTYLVYASHIAAMAPATNLGAATPVAIGGSPTGGNEPAPKADPKERRDDDAAQPGPAEPRDASSRKAVNDSVAYLRSLAELRGRNAAWAERAVREGASLSAQAALAENVIDLIAGDVAELLRRIDGRTVQLPTGPVQLATAGIALREVEPDWRTRLLQILTNPNVAYLLMLIGIYGLLLEGYNPGAVVPGVVGAISLLLALFAFQVLSVNYAGLGLIALGILLIVAESFAPSYGTLGLGGIVAFVFGSILMLDNDVPGFDVAWQLIGGLALVGSFLLLALVSFAMRARRAPVVSGREAMLHDYAEAVESFEHQGLVRVHGELWQAVTRTPLHAGQRLRIVEVRGLVLEVEPNSD
jgi:membrane-bound serine protease (ClpP class)